MLGLKVHLIIYSLLFSSLVAAGLATKHYYTRTVELSRDLTLAKAEAEFHKKDSIKLKETMEFDKAKTEELQKETASALAELDKVKQNANVKVFLDLPVPDELNQWLRKRHSGQNSQTPPAKSIRKGHSIASVRRQNRKRYSKSIRTVQASFTRLQQRQILFAEIL
jgi:hypothetical protein